MENTVIVLLLLCALSSAERALSQNNPHPDPFDLYAELRDINVKLAEDRLLIQQLQKDKQDLEAKLKELEDQNSQLEPMKEKLEDQANKLKELEKQNGEMDTVKDQLQAQATDLKSIKTQANMTTNQLEILRRDKEAGQVAFSASLLTSGSGHTGPFNAFTPLVFRHVISNIGNAYSPNTGFFIAPVRGAYHFEFYIAAFGSTHHSGAGLLKNGEHVVIAFENEAKLWGQSANGATLLLEANDIVSLRLWVNSRIYENANRHNTFSGRLLFTM